MNNIINRNPHIFFTANKPKCNIFVHEVILAVGYNIGTSIKLKGLKHPILGMQYKLDRPLYTSDWFEGTVLGMIFIGENDKGRKNFLTLDIITDGSHMGIVIGNSEIISASYSEKKIIRNIRGFR